MWVPVAVRLVWLRTAISVYFTLLYCHALYPSHPKYQITALQQIQNSVALAVVRVLHFSHSLSSYTVCTGLYLYNLVIFIFLVALARHLWLHLLIYQHHLCYEQQIDLFTMPQLVLGSQFLASVWQSHISRPNSNPLVPMTVTFCSVNSPLFSSCPIRILFPFCPFPFYLFPICPFPICLESINF